VAQLVQYCTFPLHCHHAARVHVVVLVLVHLVDLVQVGRSRGLRVERLHVTGSNSRV